MRTFLTILAALGLGLSTSAVADPGPPVAPTEIMVGEELPYAFFATPEGEGPFPVIIVLGGSEGGDMGSRGSATRFIEQGYAVLGLRGDCPTCQKPSIRSRSKIWRLRATGSASVTM